MSAPPGRLAPRSVRFRITAMATVLVALVLTVASVIITTVQRTQLTRGVDRTLEQVADGFEAQIAVASPYPGTLTSTKPEDGLAQLMDGDGTVLASTLNAVGLAPVAFVAPGELGERQRFRTVSTVPLDDDAFRVLIRRVVVADRSAVLVVAENIDDVTDSLRILRTSMWVTVPVASVVLALAVWWLVGRTLRPVESIRTEVEAIGGDDLHRRVPEPQTRDEVDRLAGTMNQMLDRLESSVARQRQFTADASHELRSPLTRMRSELEVDLLEADADLEATHRSVLEEVEGLQALVEDLLLLARSDAGALGGSDALLDLDDVVLDVGRTEEGPSPDLSAVSGASVRGDRRQLERVVRNLVDNAVRHAEGAVVLTLAERDGEAVLWVDDDGPGIAAPDRERVFERFTRLDDARAGATGGAGLGLAIVRDVVTRHGGVVRVLDAPSGGARMEVRLPAAR